jgi:phage I-like protein
MKDRDRIFVVNLSALTFAEGLVRIPLAMIGRWVKGAQKFAVTLQDIAAMVANFRKREGDTVIDYEHASEFPEVAQGQPIPAAGWLKQVEDKPDERGIWWGLAELNERCRKMIEAGELKYLSPVIYWGAHDKKTGEDQGTTLRSLAVTNTPFFDAMPAIQLSEAGWQSASETPHGGEKEQPVSNTATQEQAQEKQPRVVRLTDVPRDAKGLYDFAKMPTGDDVVYASDVFVGRHNQERAIALIDQAVKDGKVLPANREDYLKLALSDGGFESVKSIIDKSAPKVDLNERGIAGTGEEATQLTELQRVEAEIDQKVKAKMQGGVKDYGEALKLVASENADLVRRKLAIQRGKN